MICDVLNQAMLLNAFDLETSSGTRTLELRAGFFPSLGIDADLLAVSARSLDERDQANAMVTRLHHSYGLQLARTSKAVDLSGSLLNSWVSAPLALHPSPEGRGRQPVTSHFQRVALVGASLVTADTQGQPWDAFNRLFSLLAILPMQGIHCHTVAAPLFGLHPSDRDGKRDYPRLLELCRQAFRHLPELHRFILFDGDDAVLRPLGQTIDRAIHRKDPHHTLIDLPENLTGMDSLRRLMRGFLEDETLTSLRINPDLGELLRLLESEEVSPISLGLHSRRLLERLVIHSLHSAGEREHRGLNQGIQKLRTLGLDPWMLSCMHQVRTFGNWMGHPQEAGSSRRVGQQDVVAMLCSLRRVLAEYPWITVSETADKR